MSRTNPQGKIISEEQLVPRANRLVIKKKNQRMPSPNTRIPYTKPPIENQILGFMKTLGYDEDPKANMNSLNICCYKTSSTLERNSECSQQESYRKIFKLGHS
ncbi:hypothetical protein Tco_0626993 [Tanacetum coccineum]|uniref:Uncharacterized protein n=1 Tax=Tanacetum coccineum TaxID=301880 RepID=A0ABQ4WL82_9ASTR